METISNYQQQAIDFLNKTGAKMEIVFSRNGKHFADDKDNRDIYSVTITRGSRKYTFDFGQSVANSGFYYTKGKRVIELDRKYLDKEYLKKLKLPLVMVIKRKDYDFMNNGTSDKIHYPEAPKEYDILACLQKYDVGTFEDFCSAFGYDTDSKKAKKTYKAVLNEYKEVSRLFTDEEIEMLQEIN